VAGRVSCADNSVRWASICIGGKTISTYELLRYCLYIPYIRDIKIFIGINKNIIITLLLIAHGVLCCQEKRTGRGVVIIMKLIEKQGGKMIGYFLGGLFCGAMLFDPRSSIDRKKSVTKDMIQRRISLIENQGNIR